jgi:hypothetical protein
MRGLTINFSTGAICEKCNCNLKIYSSYQDKKIAWQRNKTKKKFYCIHCAQKRKEITLQDLDDYLSNLFKKVCRS